jgi:uncharacterized RDD family membrane protein YckC
MAIDDRHPTRSTPTWFREPSLSQRFFGSMIDSLILTPTYLVAWSTSSAIALWIGVAIRAVYEITLTSRFGQTIGKRLMGTRVVDSVDGSLISPLRSAVRWLALGPIFGLIDLLGAGSTPIAGLYTLVLCVMILRPPLHAGLHDHIAGTLVTSKPAVRIVALRPSG